MDSMTDFTGISTGTRFARNALIVTLAVLGSVRAAYAGDVVIKEQDLDVQGVTRALTPADSGDDIPTRGFVLSNKASGMAANPAGQQKEPSVQILITFASNSTTLTESAKSALDKVARAMQSQTLSAYRFRVEGHADPRGPADVNMKLSADRAAAVVEYLSRTDGVAAERLSSVGKGSFEPLNRRDPAAPENRRVTILTVKD